MVLTHLAYTLACFPDGGHAIRKRRGIAHYRCRARFSRGPATHVRRESSLYLDGKSVSSSEGSKERQRTRAASAPWVVSALPFLGVL